jgi:hypothetical protein
MSSRISSATAAGRRVERHGEAGTGTGGNQSMAMLIADLSKAPQHRTDGAAKMDGRTFPSENHSGRHRSKAANELHRQDAPPSDGRQHALYRSLHPLDSAAGGFRREAAGDEDRQRNQRGAGQCRCRPSGITHLRDRPGAVDKPEITVFNEKAESRADDTDEASAGRRQKENPQER